MAKIRYQQALAQALRDEMTENPSVIVLGEDVRQSLRGVTRGLHEEFGDLRVIDTPLSEQAFTSVATGAALAGMRPVVEYQIPALMYLSFEQIVNQAAKFRLMTGGQVSVPVTYLIPGSGARKGLAGQHSDNPYVFLGHAGVRTVLPSRAQDAYDLFREAIRDDDPVAVIAPAAVLGERDDVDTTSPRARIGRARVALDGDDLTIVASGHLVPEAIAASVESGMSIEVVDVRSVFPLDRLTILASVAKTRRVIVVDDSNRSFGLAAEVLASVAEAGIALLATPVRVTRADAVIPFSPVLEQELVPDRADITAAIERIAQERSTVRA
ncbi:alpha-ketoacid dehydrogenase subunit beta [soil metagenome]